MSQFLALPSSRSAVCSSIPANMRRFSVRASAACQSPSFAAEQLDFRRPPASLYEVLRVKHTASPTEIKTAYRSLAKMYHPDAVESDGRDFIEIHNAYATLSDPAARALYDLSMGGGSFMPGGIDAGSYRRRPSGNGTGFYPTRRWETDQCW